MLQYLETNQVVECIINYFKDEISSQALLLNGEWGVGKTYFVKNDLIPKLNSEFKQKPIIISLYGKAQIEDIEKEINSQILWQMLNVDENSKSKKIIKKLSKFKSIPAVVSSIVGNNIDLINNILLLGTDAIGTIKDISLKNNIIIFDDLERCSIDIKEILGFINNLAENKKVKVIIVANESAIINSNIKLNKFTPTDELINKCLYEEKNDSYNKENDSKDENALEKNNEYLSIKEKTIGMTVQYDVKWDNVAKHIINNMFKDNSYINTKNYLLKNQDLIITYFGECHNLRYLICSLNVFKKFDCLLADRKDNKYYQSIREEFLMNCMYHSIIYKSNRSIFPKHPSIKTITSTGGSLIKHYIEECFFSKEQFNTYLENVISNLEQEQLDKQNQQKIYALSINKIGWSNNWQEYEDEEINQIIQNIYNELENECYPLSWFKEVISIMRYLKWLKFNVDFEKIISYMVNYIENPNHADEVSKYDIKDLDYITCENSSTLEEDKIEYDKILKPIIDALILKTKEDIQDINIYFKDDNNFKEKFLQYCESYYKDTNYLEKNGFLNKFNVDEIKSFILKTCNKNLKSFLTRLEKVYCFSNLNEFFKIDLDNISKLIDFFDEELSHIKDKQNMIIKTILYDNIINKLKDVKQKIEEPIY